MALLKSFVGTPPAAPPLVIIDSQEEYEVEQILNYRQKQNKTEYLVKWRGYGAHENSWEPEINLRNAERILKEY